MKEALFNKIEEYQGASTRKGKKQLKKADDVDEYIDADFEEEL